MTRTLPLIPDGDLSRSPSASLADDEPGFGSLRTERGHLPLEALGVRGRIDGLLARVVVRQTFVNAFDEPMEATYIFPLPDRAAVTQFRMMVAGREIEGVLEERGRAREQYDRAIAEGHRAAIAEEDRPGVFNLKVGNLMPGERATVELTLCGVLPYADGEVTFRFPLVVAPRYIPGRPLPGPSVGDGTAIDTDAVPDASRISPPVLLPGFPNPVRLGLEVDLYDGAAGLNTIRSSLHAVEEDVRGGYRRIRVRPGERLDRDFILRFRLGGDGIRSTLTLHPDADGREQGTFALTVVPPAGGAVTNPRPRDVVFLLDRSGSMSGWKIVAARRALARMIDTLGEADRFGVMAFDSTVEGPKTLPDGWAAGTDRARFRAVEYLATVDARGGTEMAEPLERAVKRLTSAPGEGRDRLLVLITDGQVGNEDQILKKLGTRLKSIRVFAIGIDQAVNEAFLRRLAERGGGSCELVESEDRLDDVLASIHRRIGTPLLTRLEIEPEGLAIEPGEVAPRRLPDLFAGSPLLILGRYRGLPGGAIAIRGTETGGGTYLESVPASVRENPAIAAAWARGQVRQLEDRYAAGEGDRSSLEKAIVAISLRFQILCRFTAYVAIDRSEVVNEGGSLHRITQAVESPFGWADAPRFAGVASGLALGASGAGGGMRAMSARGGSARSRIRRHAAPPAGRAEADNSILVPDMAFEPIAPLYWGSVDQELCIDLPDSRLDTGTLQEHLVSASERGPRYVVSLLARIAEAVQTLHDRGMIHGRLSPSQVPVDDRGQPAVPPLPASWLESRSGVVDPGPYTAPEMLYAPGDKLSPSVDVYSLGAILYHLLTGLLPFSGRTPDVLRTEILQVPPTPPCSILPSIPAELETICLKAMATDPVERYATAGELAAALWGFLKPPKRAFWKST